MEAQEYQLFNQKETEHVRRQTEAQQIPQAISGFSDRSELDLTEFLDGIYAELAGLTPQTAPTTYAPTRMPPPPMPGSARSIPVSLDDIQQIPEHGLLPGANSRDTPLKLRSSTRTQPTSAGCSATPTGSRARGPRP